MAVQNINLNIEKGTDFEAVFNLFTPDSSIVALNNYTAIAKIKKYPTSPISHSFDVTITVARGEVRIGMGKSVTSTLSSGRNYYDIVIVDTNDGITTKAVEGFVIVTDSVSV